MIRLAAALLVSLLSLSALAADKKPPSKSKSKNAKPEGALVPSPWGDFVEKDFPFFSSVLDCRELGDGFPKDNLTPRGLILNLGHNLWACYDIDLLRIACIWEAEAGKPPVTPEALAPGSYHIAGQKTKDGQEYLPKPEGNIWLANGIYPGWQIGDKPRFTDPREPGTSKEEVGRGAYDPKLARFESITRKHSQAVLKYVIGGTEILEIVHAEAGGKVCRYFELGATTQPLTLILGSSLHKKAGDEDHHGARLTQQDGQEILIIQPSATAQRMMIAYSADTGWKHMTASAQDGTGDSQADSWPQKLTTAASLSKSTEGYVVDDIALPTSNPWKRNVRLADIAFLNDRGDAAAVSFDGDVWLISGLNGNLEKITWKRFTSGLHEPMSIVARPSRESETKNEESELFVFDRNGIWKLIDSNKDGAAETHEMFCNLFAQTAETREFPNSMKLGPDGALYISKGGQEGTTFGKHNGTVIKVAPDGKTFDVIGYGLRQPFIGVHPKTGLVTASDQQGNYVPSTPIHIISDHRFYGHLPTIAPKEQYPDTIAEPLTWIPHPVNPSGATQTWLVGTKMGPIDGELIHVGYNRPEIFRVLMNPRFKRPQAAVMSFSRAFDFGPLNASINPADGQLYVIGFQVWGTTASKLSGLSRVRYTGAPRVLLKEVTPTDKGILLRFNAKLDTKLATDPASYTAERWNYKRTADYGSPHLKLDGSTGQEWLTPSSAYLSQDGMSVLVGIPDMRPEAHQMRIGWGLKSAEGLKAENTAYFSPWDLLAFDPIKEGFGDLTVDLTPRKTAAVATVQPTAEEGERLAQMFGCMACHSIDGTTVGKVGPSWKGIYGSERAIAKNEKAAIKADEAYLRESILNPSAKVVKGFEKFDAGMPIYAGILNDSQIDSLILYIKTLK